MASFTAKIKACHAKWYPRRIVRHAMYTPFEIVLGSIAATSSNAKDDVIGYIYLNNATLVGAGGKSVTITDNTSYITITE